jgi:hypothetical protein
MLMVSHGRQTDELINEVKMYANNFLMMQYPVSTHTQNQFSTHKKKKYRAPHATRQKKVSNKNQKTLPERFLITPKHFHTK